jgi:Flp pilus assembly protein TadD
MAYLRMGKNAEAIIHLKKVLDDDPNDADVWYNLGVAQSRRGDAASARSAWEKALGADSRAVRLDPLSRVRTLADG